MPQNLTDVPRLRTPSLVNMAEYWLAPERFARRCEPLGDRFLVPMPGHRPWLNLTDPADVKEVFTADTGHLRLGAALAKAAPHQLVLGPTGLTNLDGAEHLRRRKLQLAPFHGAALAGYERTIEQKTAEALTAWDFDRPGPAAALMETITLEVIIAVVFGVTEPGRVQRLRAAVRALLREGHSRRFFVQTIIATSRKNGWDAPFRRMRAAMAAVDAVLLEEVAHRRATGNDRSDDVLGTLLNADERHGPPMPDAELCDAMRTLLLGGHETTASTLAWILERVTRHPGVLARLHAAAREDDTSYLDAVIKEGIRLRPVFPMTVRLASRHYQLRELAIPAGTMIVPNITLLHRRADLYPDPLAFRPERFLDAKPGTYSWIPFGGGPRRCIGAAFALLEARTVLRTLLRGADLEPTDTPSERVARNHVTIAPAHGATITLRPPQATTIADPPVRPAA
jgi:cytochrome P450